MMNLRKRYVSSMFACFSWITMMVSKLKALFRFKKRSSTKPPTKLHDDPQQKKLRDDFKTEIPFPVPTTSEQDETMLAIAITLSLAADRENMDIAAAIEENNLANKMNADVATRGSSSKTVSITSIEDMMITLKLDTLENFANHQDNDCSICFDDMFEKGAYMLACCHMFCKYCITNHVTTRIDEDAIIVCPLCGEDIAVEDIRELQDRKRFTKWLNNTFKKHVETNRDVYYHCPTPNCASIVEKDMFDVIRCPTCQKSACIKCYQDHDENVGCEEHLKWKELNGKADDLFTKDVKSKKYQKCPGCKRYCEKIDGCNHMKCRCGKQFNWIDP